MQNAVLFGAGRIAALEKRLLTRDEIRNLYEGEPFRVLAEKGYGGESSGSFDEEIIIANELSVCRKLTDELCAGNAFLRTLFLRADIQNLKIFIKQRLKGQEIGSEYVDTNGVYEPKLLALMVKAWEFPELPDVFRKALSALDLKLALHKDPQLVSLMLDRAYYEYARSCRDEVAETYFGTECDFVNLITLLRMKGNSERKDFEKLLMPEYKIKAKDIVDFFEGKGDIKLLTKGLSVKTADNVRDALEKCDAAYMQKLRDDCLLSILREHKNEMESPYPVIWYYAAKQREAEIVRLCCNMKRSGFPSERISEKVRELYG